MRQLCGLLIDGGENRQIKDAWSVVLSDEGATHVHALSRAARGPCTVVFGPPPLSQRPGSLGPALRVPAARVHWACGAHTADTHVSVWKLRYASHTNVEKAAISVGRLRAGENVIFLCGDTSV